MTNVALVLCPSGNSRKDWTRELAPGIHYIKSMLEYEGLEVTLINPQNVFNYPKERYLEAIEESGAKAIAISATGSCYQYLKNFSKFLKRGTDLPIGLGGFVSILGAEVLETIPSIDAMLEGEGELRSGDFFRALIDGKDFESIDGIFYRENDSIKYTKKAALISNEVLDEYVPDFSYLNKDRKTGLGLALITSSRGCYNACTFCDIREHYGKKIRSMSPKRLNEVLKMLAIEHNVGLVEFQEEDFLFRPGRLGEIADTIEEYKIVVGFQTRAQDILAEENQYDIIRLQAKGLISYVDMGIESFSDSVLKRLGKRISAEQNMQAIDFLDQAGVFMGLYLALIDRHITTEELLDNLSGIIRLNSKKTLAGYILRHFDHSLATSLAAPIQDRRGDYFLDKLRNRYVQLMDKSNKDLKLDFWARQAVKSNGFEEVNFFLSAADALHFTAAYAISPEYGDKAYRDHIKLRRDLKAMSRHIGAKKKRQRIKHHSLQKRIKKRLEKWVVPI